MTCTVHECWECGAWIAQKDGDQIAALAPQIGATLATDGGMVCQCKLPMETRQMAICGDCGQPYDDGSEGYNGLCQHCADRTEKETSSANVVDDQRARETATILAALRMWQAEAVGVRDELPYDDIATNDFTLEALTSAEIDALCERLNQ